MEVKPRGSLSRVESRDRLVVNGFFGAWKADRSLDIETPRRWMSEGKIPDAVPERCPSRRIVRTADEDVVWAGLMTPHYGHFVIESVARMWPLLPGAGLQGLPVVFTNRNDLASSQEWLSAFGVKVVDLPAEGAVRFTNLHVPEPAIRFGAWMTPELRDIHLWARRHLPVERQSVGGVLWLSRTGLVPTRTVYDEGLLEWILRDHLTVIRPETMTLPEQLAAIEASSVVAGVVGSAFHTLLMAERVPRRLVFCGDRVQATYLAQEELLGGEHLYLRALRKVPTSRPKGPRFPAGMRLLIPETIRALRRHAIPALAEDEQIRGLEEPERSRAASASGTSECKIFRLAAKVVSEPHSASARMELGHEFEKHGLESLALEQFGAVSDLG